MSAMAGGNVNHALSASMPPDKAFGIPKTETVFTDRAHAFQPL
jgi:hypothetical protein